MPTIELVYETLDYLDVRELVPIAAVNYYHLDIVRRYVKQRFGKMAGRFFPDTEAFSHMLSQLRAVVSGSAALHFMLPPKLTDWTPKDLDIYAPYTHHISLYARMLDLGYSITDEHDSDNPPYSDSLIKQVATLSNGTCKVHVIFSKCETAFAPIFEFHSTAVMNFVSPHHIFSAYPDLTFNGLSMINPGAIYFGNFNISAIDALRKYNARNFRYVNCAALGSCTTPSRTLTDSKCFWMNLHHVPYMDKSAFELFGTYQTVDAHWILGGKICGLRLQDSFVFPRVELYENEAYYPFCYSSPITTNYLPRPLFLDDTFNASLNM